MAQLIFGGLDETGKGVPKDQGLAFQWSQKAADQGPLRRG
ncbi:MAG: SEL1-like repeat protein [Deltaproteobacteria bacterium]|nr:SEL1-like repeat protein [Deltaproteobacteria bacterium]